MKKSLIAICIIGLILAGSNAMSLSSINYNNSNISNYNEEKPDFIVYSLVLEKCRCPYGYFIKVRISNIGAEIENTTVKVKVQLDSEESVIFIDYTKGVGISTKKTTHLEIDPFKKTHIALAEVDPPYENHPNGDIIESNEDNNVMTETFTKSISANNIKGNYKTVENEEDCNCDISNNQYIGNLDKLLNKLESHSKILGILNIDNPKVVSVCNKIQKLLSGNNFDEMCDSLINSLWEILEYLGNIPHTKWYSALIIIAMMGVVAYTVTFVNIICGVA